MKPLIILKYSPNITTLIPLNRDLATVIWETDTVDTENYPRLTLTAGIITRDEVFKNSEALRVLKSVCGLYNIPLASIHGMSKTPKVPTSANTKSVKLAEVPKSLQRRLIDDVAPGLAEAKLGDAMAEALGTVSAPTMGRSLSPKALPAKYKSKNTKELNTGDASYDEPAAQGGTDRYWRCDCGTSSFIPKRIKNCPKCKGSVPEPAKDVSYYTLLRAGVISFGMARNQHSRDKK